MLDLDTLNRIRLTRRPRVQRVVAWGLLAPNYGFLPGVSIAIEGAERIPDRPVIYALNHTDRYNYWPFQYALYRRHDRFTATWVKGKYYESPALAKFMELTNNIPTVSRGFLISKDFALALGRAPTAEEYETLRQWVDRAATSPSAVVDRATIPTPILEASRNPLGRAFVPASETYAAYINALFRLMMKRFVEINAQAAECGLDLLVFPQGTRSIRLSKGHVGLAQIALHFRRTIVPVGCNGSDSLYPGGSPVAKRGAVTYRIGEPIAHEDVPEFHPKAEFEPFTPEAEAAHALEFRGLTDLVMARIDGLLDERYQFAEAGESDGVEGARRFL